MTAPRIIDGSLVRLSPEQSAGIFGLSGRFEQNQSANAPATATSLAGRGQAVAQAPLSQSYRAMPDHIQQAEGLPRS